MTEFQSQIEAVFSNGALVAGEVAGDDWRISSAVRDPAVWHAVSSGPFDIALRGAGAGGDERTLGVCILFVKGGAAEIRQWGRVRSLSPGDLFVCCGWLPLSLHVEDRLEAVVCKLPAWWAVPRFLNRQIVSPDLYVPAEYFAAPVIHDLAATLLELQAPEASGQGMEMMADLLRTALTSCAEQGKTMPRIAGRMGRILQFMIQNIDQPGLSAQDAAAALKCSARTIYKTCADDGTTFNNMLMEVRLLTAQHQLLRTEDRVSQIAYAVGFASLSHFSRQFRARFGTPANAYRRLQRGR